MSEAVIICSMLHEIGGGSAAMRFRGGPVLAWTLERLRRSDHVGKIAILCRDDQRDDLRCAIGDDSVSVRSVDTRSPAMQAVDVAGRWADGWRGGLMQSCAFDAGFDSGAILGVLGELDAAAAVLVDPAAGLIDPKLIDALFEHAARHPAEELCFTPAAPGLGAVLLRKPLIERLAAARLHPGKLLHYLPDQPARDPLAGEGCVEVHSKIARTMHQFRMDSARQIHRLAAMLEPLNGQLIESDSLALIDVADRFDALDPLPREIVLEINTHRRSRRIDRPSSPQRQEMSIELVTSLFDELASYPDTRITIGGLGDPLECDLLPPILELAATRTLHLHIETDLLADDAGRVAALTHPSVDIVSVHLPAATAATYEAVMGIDGLTVAVNNIAALAQARAARGRSVPLIVPTFVKCQANLGEMEAWYDQWIRALGCAVITGPSDFAGQIVDVSVGDMSPARRVPCRRLRSRLTVLSDGRVVACEQDFAGRAPLGCIGKQSLSVMWLHAIRPLRAAHACGRWDESASAAHPLCGSCRQWDRP